MHDSDEGSSRSVPSPGSVASDEEPDVPLELWAILLHEARRTRRMSQPELARAAGVAQQTISKLERGLLCPHDRLKLRLAAALRVPTPILFPWPSLDELRALQRLRVRRARLRHGDLPPAGLLLPHLP